jgi:hypothetical protein
MLVTLNDVSAQSQKTCPGSYFMSTAEKAERAGNEREYLYMTLLRAESSLTLPRDPVWLPLGTTPPQGKAVTPWLVSSIYENTATGLLAPTDLVFGMLTRAESPKVAAARSTIVAAELASAISFIHNAYVESPQWWSVFGVEPEQGWRELHQHYFPTRIASIERARRALDMELTKRAAPYIRDSGDVLNAALFKYELALRNWDPDHALAASNYLMLACEQLTPIAKDEYIAKSGKSEDELLGEFRKVSIKDYRSPSLSDLDNEALVHLLSARDIGPIKNSAGIKLRAAARREIIFEKDQALYGKLNNLSNWFEHGSVEGTKLRPLAIQIANASAQIIRSWMIDRMFPDPGLRERLCNNDYGNPLMKSNDTHLAFVKFRSDSHHPAAAERLSPMIDIELQFEPAERGGFRLTKPKATPQFAEGTETADLDVDFHPPLTDYEGFQQWSAIPVIPGLDDLGITEKDLNG